MSIENTHFSEFIQILESLNSFSEITSEEHDGNLSFYYFDIYDKEFRIVIEQVENESGIVFEQKINGNFIHQKIQNNLSQKEVLMLFGTLKKYLGKLSKTETNVIFTDDYKKMRLYLKILKYSGEAKTLYYNEDQSPYLIVFSKIENSNEEIKSNFKFKFWKKD